MTLKQKRPEPMSSRRTVVAGLCGAIGLVIPRSAEAADGEQTKPSAAQMLGTHPALPRLGNPSGNLALIEFYDYRCTFCRSLQPAIERLLREDDQLLLVLAPWPVYGALSVQACEVALSAVEQGLFRAVHVALLTERISDESSIRLIAERAGLDIGRADREIANRKAQMEAMLQDSADTAKRLGLHGTPGLLIGRTLVPGALTYADLRQVLAEARASVGDEPAEHHPIVR